MINLLLMAAIQAAPTPPTPPATERIIVDQVRQDGTADHGSDNRRDVIVINKSVTRGKPGERREFRILRDEARRAGEGRSISADCNGGRKFETEADTVKDGKLQKTRIFLCARGADSDRSWAEQLRATGREIEGDPNLSPEAKARIRKAIDSAVAKEPATR